MSSLHAYDIHGIVSVVSEAALPELESFRVYKSIDRPTIVVGIGKPARTNGHANGHANGHGLNGTDWIQYEEWTRWRGFGIEIAHGDPIQVIASPLLRQSPHVLYTNVVEPILRWAFVERGYALVHGACISCGDDAFLITARTDTGKTTTILRTLDAQPEFDFLSDDLTIVSPEGRVLPYPKPLTISRHTLVAVRTPLLSRKERVGLFFQSRVHSRSGRRFGLLLTRSGMPMATTNAVLQWFVPPPKYPVQRLVPRVKVAPSAKLAGLIVIERGGLGEVSLEHEEALEILMSNCDDSYGFPPYDNIKSFLYGSNGHDLRPVERAVVASAIQGRPATLIRSETRDWWQRLPDFVSSGVGSVPRESHKIAAAGQTVVVSAPAQAG
jgi:dolichol-phosphate mannosyltransferase